MVTLNWLKPSEIPAKYRSSFDFQNQHFGASGSRNVLKIERQCGICEEWYDVVVSNIRGDLGRGRKMRPGKCSNCKGRIISSEGYVWIFKPDHPRAYSGRYVPEHILVMEEHLGRYLDCENESVHHKDGDRENNVISNLQLRKRYHGNGQSWECQDCGSFNVKATELG